MGLFFPRTGPRLIPPPSTTEEVEIKVYTLYIPGRCPIWRAVMGVTDNDVSGHFFHYLSPNVSHSIKALKLDSMVVLASSCQRAKIKC